MKPVKMIWALTLLHLTPGIAAADGNLSPGWSEIRSIFTDRCVMCHSSVAGASKGLRLDDYAAALRGGERGVVLIPGDTDGSELMKRLRGASLPRMPFLGRPLPEEQILLIEAWVAAGMPE